MSYFTPAAQEVIALGIVAAVFLRLVYRVGWRSILPWLLNRLSVLLLQKGKVKWAMAIRSFLTRKNLLFGVLRRNHHSSQCTKCH